MSREPASSNSKEPVRREMVCISCPIGCRLTVTAGAGGVEAGGDAPSRGDVTAGDVAIGEVRVEGNRCPRGEIYGIEEMRAPKRVVTATVATDSPVIARLPVRTTRAIAKELIAELLNEIYRIRVAVPIRAGDVIVANIQGSGVDLIASRSLAVDARRDP